MKFVAELRWAGFFNLVGTYMYEYQESEITDVAAVLQRLFPQGYSINDRIRQLKSGALISVTVCDENHLLVIKGDTVRSHTVTSPVHRQLVA